MDALMERADVEKKKKGENIMKVRITQVNQSINGYILSLGLRYTTLATETKDRIKLSTN